MTISFPAFEDRFVDDVRLVEDAEVGAWLAFTVSERTREFVVLRHVVGEQIAFEHHFDSAFRPALDAAANGCVLAFVSMDPNGALRAEVALVTRDYDIHKATIDGDHDVLNIDIAHTDETWLVRDEISDDGPVVRLSRLLDNEVVDETVLPGHHRTPAIVSSGETVCVACVAGRIDRSVAVFEDVDGSWRRIAQIDDDTAEMPAITVLDGDPVVAWHHNVGASRRWLRAARIVDGTVEELQLPTPPAFGRADSPTDQGWEFPSLAVCRDELALLGRSAQNFHLSFFDGTRFGARVPQSPDGWGGCGRRSTLAVLDDELAFARAERRKLVVSPVRHEAPPLDAGRPDYDDVEVDPPAAPASPPPGILFGQLHQHTAHSDGTGTMWDVLLRGVRSGLDFVALTDHDVFCGNAIGPLTWRAMCVVADELNRDLPVLHALEFTGARDPGPGHKNLYFEGELPTILEEHTRDGLDKTLAEYPAIVIPHHVGFTGWDIDFHDPDIQPLWEMTSVHGSYEGDGYETVFEARGDALIVDHTVRGALDRGAKFGFCAGADDHGLLYHHGTTPRRDPAETGLTAIVDAPKTRAGILQAMRARRCYATTGAKIGLRVTLDGHPMGADVELDRDGELRIEVAGTAPLQAVDIMSSWGDEVIELDGGSLDTSLVKTVSADRCGYLYVRVRQVDHDIAWASPFFIEPTG